MRTYPADIASAILDSTYPPQENLHVTGSVYRARAFLHIADLCAADAICHTLHPDVAGHFLAAITSLNAHPVSFTYFSVDDHQQHAISLTGSLFASLIVTALYSTAGIAQIPQMVDHVLAGDDTLAESWLGPLLASYDTTAAGMDLSVECAKDAPFATPQAIINAVNTLSAELHSLIQVAAQSQLEQCAPWSVPAVPVSEKMAVTSAIPTLVFEGGLDGITPSQDGTLAAQTLSQSYQAFFAYETHGVQFPNACAATIAVAFFEHPQTPPDMSCIGLQVPLRFS
jgi:hypothetical protein